MRKASVLPIAVMAFAIVAFLVMVDYSISGGKWPWSTEPKATTTSASLKANVDVTTNSTNTNGASHTLVNTNVSNGAGVTSIGTKTDVHITSPNGGETFDTHQTITIQYSISQEFRKKITTDMVAELYLVRADGIIAGNIGTITDYTKTSFVWNPQQLIHNAGLDFTTNPTPAGKYTILLEVRKKVPPTGTGGDYPVDLFTDGYDQYDGQQVNVIRDGKNLYTYDLLAQDTNDSAITLTDFTADWKTYTNTTYNYSVKYPADWKTRVDEISPDAGVLYRPSTTQTYPDPKDPLDAYISITKLDNPSGGSLQKIFDAQYQQCLEDVNSGAQQFGCPKAEDTSTWKKVVIDNVSALRSGKRDIPEGLPNDGVYIDRGNYFLVITASYYNLKGTYDLAPVFDQILSTFTFKK